MSIIDVKNLTHTYLPGTPYEKKALDDITLSVNQGEFLGVVGANGSGKSTLIQHFNGLLSPTSGEVTVCGRETSDKKHRNELWKKVGLVFQYPEQQIFEATVFEDVSYGPRNLGLGSADIERRTMEALEKVGLEPGTVAGLSPISLSGGLRRRVAIAGVLAMRPEILVLDEPTAGLDHSGREMILELIKKLQREDHITIVMVSHSIREIILVAGRVAVLEKGRLAAYGDTEEVLRQKGFQNLPGVMLPDYLQLIYTLAGRGQNVNPGIVTLAEAELEIAKLLEEKNK
ncbi:energy-coupling factor transporter ATPase [Pelotomaculum isophthalicicum JI]|uniref:Energy-coupling factor transporter ATP-binding protein EcfA2 n=2 Tax=Pelotomaculum TaxID=191373 RepID=A0A9X4H704_9FIRM|nr:energy-coupling factor transporter ATPase [Pelotomaculum isophthalicicum]MDF9409518.1 energy-coupling factor transporter ATPase [Pelotomaculum isophthalicicum JI]